MDLESLPEKFGRYQILEILGRGGMGTVYLAHDTLMDKQVAIKVPNRSLALEPQTRDRFFQEARAAGALHHPNICPVLAVGQIDGIHYLTMMYIEGKPLSAILRDSPLGVSRASELVRTIALALAEAHEHGVIHRDLKPSNIMINKRGEPVVMDFGLARRLDKEDVRLTPSGSIMGTPAHMSPEQVSGKLGEIGPASDIYSLGVILYELWTGRIPFQGSMGEIMAKILTERPVSPYQFRTDLDPHLEAICLKAMSRNVSNRFKTMREFAAALAGEEKTTQIFQSVKSVVPRSPRLRPILTLAIAIILLVGGIGFIFNQNWFSAKTNKYTSNNGDVSINAKQPLTNKTTSTETTKSKPGLVFQPGRVITIPEKQKIQSVSFRNGDTRAAAATRQGDYTLHFHQWNLSSGESTQSKPSRKTGYWAILAPDGNRFLTFGFQDDSALWSLNSNLKLQQFQAGMWAYPAAISRDGRWVVIGKRRAPNSHFIWFAQV